MADVFSKEKRSWLMGRVRGKNTKPEKMVRSFLHRLGFRYSLHRPNLPGSPDIVLSKHRAVVFIHGCFWHGHRGCTRATLPATRKAFWRKKIEGNARRDKMVQKALKEEGWRVYTVWECQTHSDRRIASRVKGLLTE